LYLFVFLLALYIIPECLQLCKECYC
jgi:hypothetical protein